MADAKLRARTVIARLGIVCLIALLGFALYAPTQRLDGMRPLADSDDDRVLQEVSKRSAELRKLQAVARARADAPDLATALRLARENIEQARALSDPRYLGRAQAALKPWWNSPSPPHGVLVLRAVIRQSNHEFAAALADLSLALEIAPEDAQAWLTQSSLQVVRGDYAAARRSCGPLHRLATELVATACLAAVDGVTGRADAAHDALHDVLARSNAAHPGLKCWALTLLAELARYKGDPATAERHFRAALAHGQDDAYLLAAWADFLLDRGRPREVVALLEKHTEADGLLLRLALAEAQLRTPRRNEHAAELAERFAASRARGDRIHLREEARYVLKLERQPARALELALENWRVQHEAADARLVLEAALATGDVPAAQPVLEWLHQTQFEAPYVRALARQLGGAPR